MKSIKIILFSFALFFATLLSAQDQCSVFGWANLDGQTYVGPIAGGGNVTPIEVTTFAELKAAAESSTPKVIYVKNSVGNGYKGTTGDVLYVKSNKTIVGYPGVTVKCSWQISNVNNIIIRNMTLQGPGNSNSEQNWDVVAINGSKRIWVDHCMVLDGEDGNFDVSKGSDNVSVTWCIFTYSADGVHNLSNLVGGSDTETISHGKLNITYANCWWNNVNSRTPRTRYGMIHVLNCYYSNSPGPTCGFMSNMRVEGCYFDHISNPIGLISDGGLAGSFPIDCYFDNCSGNTAALSKGGYTVFTPPYAYNVTPAANVKAMVTNSTCGAGPNMLNPTDCACPAVNVPVTGVSVSPTTVSLINNETQQLTATITPSDASNKMVSWTSSNPSVATVSSTGLVSGVSGGSTTITATTQDGGKTASSEVTVTIVNIPVSGISVSPTTAKLNIGQKTQLTTTIEPSNASNKIVSWSSGNNSIATVSSTGLVTGLSEGTTAITATTEDGAKVAACEITVIYSPLPTPLIKLDFDENTGSSIANKGSVSATLTKTDIPVWSANIPENGGTSALDFGTTVGNNYVESAAIINELANLTSFTITGWVNCRNSTVGSGGNRIVSWINNGANGADVVYMSDGSLKLGVNEWPDKTTAISSAGKITTDANAGATNWKYFAITYQSTTGATELYFGDNTTSASLDKTFTYNKGAVGAAIGKLAVGHFNAESSRTSRTDRMFKGLIDQIQVFGSVLTAQEIQLAQNIGTANGVSKLNSENGFKTFPNPVVDKLNIELDQELTSDVTIQLYDNMGRFVLNTKSNSEKLTLNLKDFHSGIYLVKISNSKQSFVRRILKD